VDKALEAFKQARTEYPDDVRTVASQSDFLMRIGRLAEAREGYQWMLSQSFTFSEDKDHARRQLAIATAADPDYSKAREALEMLRGAPGGTSSEGESPADRRNRAVILALQKDRTSKLEAIKLLEENTNGRTPGEQFLLAQLHNQVGNQPRVRVVMTDLLRSEKNKISLYVSFYAAWLLREGDLRGAEEWINQMAKIEPNSLRTAELKARLAAANKNLNAARAAIVPKADMPSAPVGLIARVCEDIGLYEDAERLLKRYVEQNKAKTPELVLATAAYYGRRGRTAEALAICEQSKERFAMPVVGEVAVNILYNATPATPGDLTKVAGWIQAAADKAKDGERAALLQQLAALRNLQGDYASSLSLYRQVLSANPRDVLALNNLAYLISAYDKNHAMALTHIENAKKIIGPNPELLDTEALIRLNSGEPETALKLLEVVVAEAPSGPAYFHLAQAELAAGHKLEAGRAWRRAKELNVSKADLHPLEWPGYESLAKQLN
jgi:cellulose synthase operon protein C